MMKRTLAVLVLTLCAGCSSGGSTAAPAPATTTPRPLVVHGHVDVDLDPGPFLRDGAEEPVAGFSSCTADDGYDDIAEGTQVLIADDAGATLALTSLRSGVLQGEDGASITSAECRFSFTAPDVPRGKGFYGVTLGRRGEVKYPESRLDTAIVLTLR